MKSLPLLFFIYLPAFSSSLWEDLDYAIDAYKLTHTVDLEMSEDASMIGDISQILIYKTELWILDGTSTKQVKRFTLEGKFIGLLGATGQGPGEYDQPVQIAFSPSGEVYLYDLSSRKITVYNPDLTYQRDFPITFQNMNRAIFPRGIEAHDGRLFVRLAMNYSNTYLAEITPKGDILQPLMNSKEVVPQGFFWPKLAFIGDQLWLGRVNHSSCRIWSIHAFKDRPKTIPIRGYPNMIKESKFDLVKGTYDGVSLKKRWYAQVNSIKLLVNVDNRFAMVGLFRHEWPDLNAKPYPSEMSPEEIIEANKAYTEYVNIYEKNGQLVRAKLPLRQNRFPLERPYLLSSHDSKHLFYYSWREETEQNPIIQIYRFKGGS